MTLQQVPVGQSARVVSLRGNPQDRERVAELGFTVGQVLKVLRKAPLGCPMEVLVRGYRLAIRDDEAMTILVSLGITAEA